MRGQKTKYLYYFDLRDVFLEPGCPICRLVERESSYYLNGLFYERVNDVGTRKKLRDSLGFCNWHAWKATNVHHSASKLGVVYEDILKHVAEALSKFEKFLANPTPRSFLVKLFRRWKGIPATKFLGPLRCPACENVRFSEKVYLRVLLDFLPEEDFQKQFQSSSGICLPHLMTTLQTFPQHEDLPRLIRSQIEKFECLRKEVDEFIRKHNFQYANERWGAEIDSWKRALEIVSGKREVFPNQMDRSGYRNFPHGE
jgi:hypothetical protein